MSTLPTLCHYGKTSLFLQKYNPNSSTNLFSQIFKLLLEAKVHEKSVRYHATAVFLCLFILYNIFTACQYGWNLVGDKCYFFSDVFQNYARAKEFCEELKLRGRSVLSPYGLHYSFLFYFLN